MRITANRVTFLRLLLLPVPVVLLYRESLPARLAALVLFVLLGLTDALDGVLARRHGSTPLGELLDPVADKIFLAATYLPLADLGFVPLGLVAVLFVRELAVTALRSVALEEGLTFRTTRVAKVKTAVQMTGAAFIFLIGLFPSGRIIGPLLGLAVLGSLVPVVLPLLRRRRPGWKAAWAAILIGAAGAFRLLLPPPQALAAIMTVIVGVTLVSAADYLWGMRHVLAARFRRAPVEAARIAGLSLAVPAFVLAPLERPEAPSFLVLGLLAAELAAGGIDNSLVSAHLPRQPAQADLLRSTVQVGAGVAMLVWVGPGTSAVAIRLPVLVALAVTLADAGFRYARHRDALRGAQSGPRATSADRPA